MININAHRKGYKHTPLGWIPEEWAIKSLSDEIEYLDAGVSVNSTDELVKPDDPAVLKTSAISEGNLKINQRKKIVKNDINRAKLNPIKNSIIISRMNTPDLVGECAYVDQTFDNIYLPDRLWQTRFFEGSKVNVKWLNFLLNSPKYKSKIRGSATGTSNSMKNISKESFLNIVFPRPTEVEQQKVATILSTWDEAISKTRQLIAQLQERNKGLIQQLLTGQKRLKGFVQEWQELHLGDLFLERNETNYCNLPLLSITWDRGVILQSNSDKKDTSNEDKSKYKRICIGDIGYNTMRMWQGRSALSTMEGIVSPAYTIVVPKKKQYSPFYAFLFKVPSVIHKFFRNSQGLVDDTLNCKYKDFSIVKIKVPGFDEQVAIAQALTQLSEEIKLQEKRLELLQEQKKGLMQKLLTGEMRVSLKRKGL